MVHCGVSSSKSNSKIRPLELLKPHSKVFCLFLSLDAIFCDRILKCVLYNIPKHAQISYLRSTIIVFDRIEETIQSAEIPSDMECSTSTATILDRSAEFIA